MRYAAAHSVAPWRHEEEARVNSGPGNQLCGMILICSVTVARRDRQSAPLGTMPAGRSCFTRYNDLPKKLSDNAVSMRHSCQCLVSAENVYVDEVLQIYFTRCEWRQMTETERLSSMLEDV